MSGPLGTSGGGAAGVTSVTAGNGITVTGTTTPTIAASIAAGTGVSIAGTTTLTVSATGVNSVSAGTGISVSGTTALTVSATGVQSLTAGNGITVSGTTTPTVSASLAAGTGIGISGTTTLSVSNTGVTSIVAGTNVSVSGATGAVTVNAPAYGTTITASTIGGTAAAGTSTGVAREDHKHAFPAGATAGASAAGDTAATGTAATVALSDHRHSREAFGTPVVVNGQTTSLATGSLTTLARADHVHTMSNVVTFLGSAVVSSPVVSVTFSSFPSTVNNLVCYFTARGTTTNPNYELLSIRYNGASASTNIYYSTQDPALAYEARICVIPPSVAFPSGQHGGGFFTIHDIQNTARHKVATSAFVSQYNSGSPRNLPSGFYGAIWESTAAITSVTFLATIANLDTGSKFYLYGYP